MKETLYFQDLPESFDLSECKFHFDIKLGKMLQNAPIDSKDESVPYLKAANVGWGNVDTTDPPEMWANQREIMEFGVLSGDLLVCEGGEAGRACIIREVPPRCIIQNALHRVRSKDATSVRYLYYILQHTASSGWFEILCNKATIAHFTGDKFGSLKVPLPPQSIQKAIILLLDKETCRIDTLISKKIRQIELLQEKRIAIITRAVTGGLTSNVKVIDSGVEWVREIPNGWRVIRLKHLVSDVADCHHDTPEYVDDGEYPAIRTADVWDGFLDLSNAKKVSREAYEKRIVRLQPKAGDIIYSREGERFGKAALVPDGVELCLAQRVMLLRVKNEHSPNFVMWALNSKGTLLQAQQDVYGSTSPHVNVETIVNFFLPVPPRDVQETIIRAVERELKIIDSLISQIRLSIGILRELRASLITAAVSGHVSKMKNGTDR